MQHKLFYCFLHLFFTIAAAKLFNLSLRNNLTIQKITSFFLLLVFMISVAPKTYFHDVLAHHKDTVVVCNHPFTGSPCLHQSTINCHFDLLVVTALYEFKAEVFTGYLSPIISRFICPPLISYSFQQTDPSESRGPPARV